MAISYPTGDKITALVYPDDSVQSIVSGTPNNLGDPVSYGCFNAYSPTSAQLKSFFNYLWSSSIFDNWSKLFTNPADCIISIHRVPCPVHLQGTPEYPYFGSTQLTSLPTEWYRLSRGLEWLNGGYIDVEDTLSNYLNYDSYVKCQLYIPRIGYKPISPVDVIGHRVKIYYCINVITGAMTCYVSKCDYGTNNNETLTNIFTGNCKTDMLWSGSQRGLDSMAQIISSALALTGQVISATTIGAVDVAGMLESGLSLVSALADNPQFKGGKIDSDTGETSPQYAFMDIMIPKQYENDTKAFTGYPLNTARRLSTLSGFTTIKECELNINCTASEKEEIMNYLQKGVRL